MPAHGWCRPSTACLRRVAASARLPAGCSGRAAVAEPGDCNDHGPDCCSGARSGSPYSPVTLKLFAKVTGTQGWSRRCWFLARLPPAQSRAALRDNYSAGSAGILHGPTASLEKTASKGVTVSLWISLWALILFLVRTGEARLPCGAMVSLCVHPELPGSISDLCGLSLLTLSLCRTEDLFPIPHTVRGQPGVSCMLFTHSWLLWWLEQVQGATQQCPRSTMQHFPPVPKP